MNTTQNQNEQMSEKCYFGYYLRQRVDTDTVAFFTFYARVKDIKEWVGIKRVADSPQGTQRVLRKTRLRAVKKFVSSNTINTIPNNIVVAFDQGKAHFTPLNLEKNFSDYDHNSLFNYCNSQLNWGYLEFSYQPNQDEMSRPALIVDGQHRLYGLCEYEGEDIPILVVALIDSSPQEQAFQFIVINNKAVKIQLKSVKSIVANFNEKDLQERLLDAGVTYGKQSPILKEINNSSTSPFRSLLDWEYNKKKEKRLIPITAIEQSLRYINAQFNFLDKEDDTDSLIEIFCSIWRAVQIAYPELWGKDNKLMKKVSINAVNEFVTERLKYAWESGSVDLFEPSTIEQETTRMINQDVIPAAFWRSEWSVKPQDNASVRKQIKDDLAKMTNNYRLNKNWNDGVKLSLDDDFDSEDDDDYSIL